MSNIVFKLEECSHAKGSYFYDVLVPGLSPGEFYTIGDLYPYPRGGVPIKEWKYGQEDDCCSLSADELICIAGKLLELNLKEKENVKNDGNGWVKAHDDCDVMDGSA